MKILIVGEGAKETALATQLENYGSHEVMTVPGNPGTKRLEEVSGLELTGQTDAVAAAEVFLPDCILIIDENLIASGLADTLSRKHFLVFAPTQAMADAIHDKPVWAQRLKENGSPVTDFLVFDNFKEVWDLLSQFEPPFVLKELENEKRFAIVYSHDEAREVLEDWYQIPDNRVMVSEYENGIRFNLPMLVFENRVIPMQPYIIWRGVYEHEDDAQAKGMGSVSPAWPFLHYQAELEAVDRCIKPLLEDFAKQGLRYSGILTGEFVDEGSNIRMLHVKAGVSETGGCATFMRLQSDLPDVIYRMVANDEQTLAFDPQTACTIALTAADFPEGESFGTPIVLDEEFEGSLFDHHTAMKDGQLVTDGGRVMIVGNLGSSLEEACENARNTAAMVHCDDLFYRTDIGESFKD